MLPGTIDNLHGGQSCQHGLKISNQRRRFSHAALGGVPGDGPGQIVVGPHAVRPQSVDTARDGSDTGETTIQQSAIEVEMALAAPTHIQAVRPLCLRRRLLFRAFREYQRPCLRSSHRQQAASPPLGIVRRRGSAHGCQPDLRHQLEAEERVASLARRFRRTHLAGLEERSVSTGLAAVPRRQAGLTVNIVNSAIQRSAWATGERVRPQVRVCVARHGFKAVHHAISSPRIVVRAPAKVFVSIPRRCSIET